MFLYLPYGPTFYGQVFGNLEVDGSRVGEHTVLEENSLVVFVPGRISVEVFRPRDFIALQKAFSIRHLWLVDRVRNMSGVQGALAQIVDHRNLSGINPLSGYTPIGDRPWFPDVSRAYSKEDMGLRQIVVNTVGPDRFEDAALDNKSELAAHIALSAAYAGMKLIGVGWEDESDNGREALGEFIAASQAALMRLEP